jgi:hypothetical protein
MRSFVLVICTDIHDLRPLEFCTEWPRSLHTVSGAFSLLFSTTVFPAATAGATFLLKKTSGAFQGITIATTPKGCLSDMFRKPGVFKLVWPCAYDASPK